MPVLRPVVVCACAALMSAAAIAAAEQWKTVQVGDDPSFTMSVPAAAKVDGRKDANDLLFFAVTAGLHSSAWCSVMSIDYPKDTSQAQYAAALATTRREMFCNVEGATIKDAQIVESRSFDHKGLQAAACATSYTDSAAKAPGQVRSHMIVAAPRATYVLSCTVEDETQFDAEGDWTIFWAEKIRFMQDSLRVPQ